ncbi:MAG: shikimate kinase [Eggerthellaceae bacterium]|nr:shikimate kinase [Eggerthellaceae bacterium]
MSYSLSKPVFFIGFMAAGKSTVALELSIDDVLPLIDLDSEAEDYLGKSIDEVFAQDGEEEFRRVESQLLARAIERMNEKGPALVSCGGGIIESPENYALLKRRGAVVYLDVTFDEALRRIEAASESAEAKGAARPLLTNTNSARELYEKRQDLYMTAADIIIFTTGVAAADVVNNIREELVAAGILF